MTIEDKPQDSSAMQQTQTNQGNAKAWQTEVKGGIANIAETLNIYYNDSSRKLGVTFQAPPLPSYYVDRPEVSQELKTRLLQPQSANGSALPALMISAIHGLGAIGKSTVATALAHDSDVRQHFSDGILWATLGQQPNILSLLGSWIQALGDYNFQGTTVEASTAHLRTLLQDKVALLVVDDAWDASHAQAFLVGGKKCQVLITSRDKLIATSVGAGLYSLDVMNLEQSLQLLTQWLGRSLTAAETPQAEELAREVGYLPLALELVAAQVADRIAWAELLQDLRAEVAYLEALDLVGAEDVTDEASSKRLSLRKSLNLSIRRLTQERRQQFAWFGVLPEDVMITPAMAATLWNISPATAPERKARDTLRYLRDKAILLDGLPLADGTATYRLHDMFHALAKNVLTASPTSDAEGHLAGLGLTLPQAHAELLNRYRQKTQQQQWHTVPNDGYIHEQLVEHMEQAGWVDEIHALFRETAKVGRNGWYEARERLGQTAGYISDVHKAWKLANQTFLENLCPEIIGIQCRYTLIISSLNNISDILGELLVSLVKKCVWTPEQGLIYARQILDPGRKANNLMLLAEELPTLFKQEALYEALEAAKIIRSDIDRASTLATLASKLPPELLLPALEAAQAIEDKTSQFRALVALANRMPDAFYKALETAQKIDRWDERSNALAALVSNFPKVLPQALETAREIGSCFSQSRALLNLVTKMPPELLPQALKIIETIEHDECKADALVTLATKMPSELLLRALEIIKAIESEYYQSSALAALIHRLPFNLLSEVLEIAQGITDRFSRARVFAALAEQLPEVLPEALKVIHEVEEPLFQAKVLANLVNKFPEVLPQALEAAQANPDTDLGRSSALAHLVAKLPLEFLPQSLEIIRTISMEVWRAVALEDIVEKLSPDFLVSALEIALSIKYKKYRFRALAVLANKLPPELLPQALEAVQTIEDEKPRFRALAALSNKLPELLPQALGAALLIKSPYDQTEALIILAKEITPELLPQVLEALQTIGDMQCQFRVLAALADTLPEVLPQALEAAQAIKSDDDRAFAITALASKLPEVLPQALEAVQAIENEELRSYRLANLVNKLPLSFLPQALDLALSLENAECRFEALAALNNKLPGILPQTLKAAQACLNVSDRYRAIATLSNNLPPELLSSVLETAQTIEGSDSIARFRAFAALAKKLPEVLPQALEALQMIRGDNIQANEFATLVDLADKLPEVLPQALLIAQGMESGFSRCLALIALADKLPEVLPQALEALQEDGSDYCYMRALGPLAKKLPPNLLPQALNIAQAIESEPDRSHVLTALANLGNKLSPNLLFQLFETAQAIKKESDRLRVLEAFFPQCVQFSTIELCQIWLGVVSSIATLYRPIALECWGSLAPVIFTLGGKEAVVEVANAIDEICHWWR